MMMKRGVNMTKEEVISLIQTYGVTEEKAREIAEYIGDKSFYIGKGDTKPKEVYIMGVDLAETSEME